MYCSGNLFWAKRRHLRELSSRIALSRLIDTLHRLFLPSIPYVCRVYLTLLTYSSYKRNSENLIWSDRFSATVKVNTRTVIVSSLQSYAFNCGLQLHLRSSVRLKLIPTRWNSTETTSFWFESIFGRIPFGLRYEIPFKFVIHHWNWLYLKNELNFYNESAKLILDEFNEAN